MKVFSYICLRALSTCKKPSGRQAIFLFTKTKALCTLQAPECSLLGSWANTFCWQAPHSPHADLQWLHELCPQIPFFFSATGLTADPSGYTTCFTCSWKEKKRQEEEPCPVLMLNSNSHSPTPGGAISYPIILMGITGNLFPFLPAQNRFTVFIEAHPLKKYFLCISIHCSSTRFLMGGWMAA